MTSPDLFNAIEDGDPPQLAPPFDHMRVGRPFSWPHVYSIREDLPAVSGRGIRVGVIGAGVAGLVAAFELWDRGFDVTVFEAEKHIGGRVRTYRFTDTAYGELGAMRVPLVHAATMHYVERLGLETRLFGNWNPRRTLYFGGVHASAGIVPPDATSKDNEPGDQFGVLSRAFPGFRAVTRERLTGAPLNLLKELVVDPLLRQVAHEGGLWNLFKSEPPSHLSHLQDVILSEYVTSDEIGLSPADWTYLSRATGAASLGVCSPIQFLIDMVPVMSSAMYEIVGGMDRLPTGLADSLTRGAVHTEARVYLLRLLDTAVELNAMERGQLASYEFDAVFVATTPRAFEAITVLPASEVLNQKTDALRRTVMGKLAKTLVHVREPFWVQAGDVDEGGLSCTDLSIRQTWYPRVAFDVEKPADQVFTASYRWGDDAVAFTEMSDDERTEAVLADVATLHQLPESDLRSQVLGVVHHVWPEGFTLLPRSEGFAQYLRSVQEPLADPRGRPRVFFVGEYAGKMHGWMVSAIQPALSAVRAFLVSMSTR
jgi:monoamine oxidase